MGVDGEFAMNDRNDKEKAELTYELYIYVAHCHGRSLWHGNSVFDLDR